MTNGVYVDLSGIERKFSDSNIGQAWAVVAQRVLQDSNKYVPVVTGNLKRSGHIDAASRTVVWQGDDRHSYAQYVYNMDSTRSGHPHWVEYAKGIHIDDWVKTAEEAFK